MHESIFGYNLSRPYPYRWFTWVVILGGIIAAGLLSVLNLAANGYEPSTIYVTDPNSTESPANLTWYQKKPWSRAAKISSKCQDQVFTVDSQFYTSNLGLSYQLSRIWDGSNKPRASFSYHNDYLHDCSVQSIMLAPTNPDNYLSFDIEVTTDITCVVYEDGRPITIELNLAASFEPRARTAFHYLNQGSTPTFLIASNTTQPALWWSTIFMSSFAEIFYSMRKNQLTRYTFEQYRRDTVFSLTIMKRTGFCFGESANISLSHWSSKFGSDALLLLSPGWKDLSDADVTNTSSKDRPIAQFALYDSLAKLIYAIILSDLGQANEGNILASANDTLNAWNTTAQYRCFLYSIQEGCTEPWTYFGNITQVFPQLGTNESIVEPATISTQYTCQVPKLKSPSSLIISVIVADLVLLQVLWKVLNWGTTLSLERRHPEASYCSGCAKHFPMTDMSDITSKADRCTRLTTHESTGPISPSRSFARYEPLPNIATRPLSVSNLPTSISTDSDMDRDSGQERLSVRSVQIEQRRRISDEESPPSPQ